jgi:putative sterol carrier protein
MGESDPREQLAAIVEGKSDDEINEVGKQQGFKTILSPIFQAMASRFQPDKAAGQSAVIQYDITTPDETVSYSMSIADGKCELNEGPGENPRVTLEISFPNWLRMVAGKADGMQLFMSGQLKISGDMMFAQVIQSWFGA